VSPKGRLGFYGAHPGFNESALSFLLIDAGTRQSLQLMFSYRPPDGAQKIDEKATAKSMSAIFDTLKKAAFSLEKKYWR
jgi:hypothetical protein